jgi:uncharacterized protein (TIGR04255 family)
MTDLSNAPLLEAWMQLRWGTIQKGPPSANITEFTFTPDDLDYFVGQFREVARREEFVHIERLTPSMISPLPHAVTHRFRKQPNSWPCLQIGLGIFTVNQVNDGYGWEKFKQDVLRGLVLLDSGHPLGLGKLPKLGVELSYRDGFVFKEGETSIDFVTGNLHVGFKPPADFLAYPHLNQEPSGISIHFKHNVSKPQGELIVEIKQGLINGQPGMIMDTIVRSTGDHSPDFETNTIAAWLEEAHDLQRHAFKSLIDPVYARTFQ